MADLFELTQQAIAGLSPQIELVSVEWGKQGLLCVTIDTPEGIRIEHCEQVSRHLSHVYEVENIDYQRLEVSSPGLDRPLRTAADFERFQGERVEVKLHQAINSRKVFSGILGHAEPQPEASEKATDEAPQNSQNSEDSYTLEVQDDPKKPPFVLSFQLADVAKAKLDPLLNFKGKKK